MAVVARTDQGPPRAAPTGNGSTYPPGVSALIDKHREHLRTSGLGDAIIAERGYLSAQPEGVRQLEVRMTKAQRRSGIIYPQFELGRPDPHHWELRPDQPRDRNGKPKKYERPRGVPQVPDVLPRYREALYDPSIPLWITEGVKKADALADLGLLAVCLPGVYGYRTRVKGAAVTHPGLRDEVAWQGRRVVLAFDADRETNRQVFNAVRRFAALLAGWGAAVHLLYLPQDGDAKVGVDDYLVTVPRDEGVVKLEALVRPYSDGVMPGDKLGTHPETGATMYNPPGYQGGHAGRIMFTDPRTGTTRVMYTGDLVVAETGRTLEGEERLTVRFKVGQGRTETVTAPRADLVRARGVLDHLGGAGANVHEGNAREVARYIGEFSSLNADALPRRAFTGRLGSTPTGIIGPTWCVGEAATYTGRPLRLTVKGDRATYLAALRGIGTWEPGAWLPRVLFGLVAASPHFDHLDAPRNPVVGLAAGSNAGKGTLARFVMGLYAYPAHPMMISGIRTRTTAVLQALDQLGGLPMWMDEAHQLDDRTLTDGVYAFANRQTYARGGRDGIAKGGDPLRGVMLLTGEGLADLTTSGARNRVLLVDGDRHNPLGNANAPDRVQLLDRAVSEAAGSVGEAVTRHLWEQRDTWVREVHALADQLVSEAPVWHLAAAAAEVTLRHTRVALDLAPDPVADGLAGLVLAVASEGWREVDPAREAFERVRDLVIAARSVDGVRVARDGGALARIVSREGADVWAVRATAVEVEDTLKRYGGARVVAPVWRKRGYITPDRSGRSAVAARLGHYEPAVRCYVFPVAMFDAERDDDAIGVTTAVGDGIRAAN